MDGAVEYPFLPPGFAPPPKPGPRPAPEAAPEPAPGHDAGKKAAVEARAAKELLIPVALSRMVGEQSLGGLGAKAYVEAVLAEAGSPADPVEAILVQQLLLAHHRLALLYLRADQAQTPEHLKILNGTANRLLGELRRLALSIKAYRQPASSRSFSVIAQQNVVASGTQQVQYLEPATAAASEAKGPPKNESRGELEAPTATGGFGGRLAALNEQPAGEEPAEGRRRKAAAALG